MKRRVLLISCSLLFLIGFIALIIGLYMWRSNTGTDNVDVTTTPTISVEPTTTPKVTITPKVSPTPESSVKVLQDISLTDKTYTGDFFTVLVPAGWRVVQRGSDIGSKTVFIEKGDYHVRISASFISSDGVGYPYNGVCASEKIEGRFFTDKFERIDNIFDSQNSKYEDWACNIDKSIQLGDKVWLGSRLIDKNSANPWISPYKYFGNNTLDLACSSLAYFINYQHTSQNDMRAKYPVWESTELKEMLTQMDKIGGSVVFTKGASYFCHTDGLG